MDSKNRNISDDTEELPDAAAIDQPADPTAQSSRNTFGPTKLDIVLLQQQSGSCECRARPCRSSYAERSFGIVRHLDPLLMGSPLAVTDIKDAQGVDSIEAITGWFIASMASPPHPNFCWDLR